MKGIWLKSIIAAAAVIALNIIIFVMAALLRHNPESHAAAVKSAEPAAVHQAVISGPAMLLLFGGFFILLGVTVGMIFVIRRISRSAGTETGTEPDKKTGGSEAKPLEAKPADYSHEEAEIHLRRLEAVLGSMFEGLVALDSSLRIVLVNPRLCQLFGMDKEKDWRGVSLLEFSRSAELEEAARQVLSTGQPFELALRRYISGTEQHFQVLISPLETMPAGVVMVLEDKSRLAKLQLIRKDFAANVSHELRTPIQVVKGFAENILNSSLDNKEEIRRFAEIIQKNARTMENLTNDLLTLVSLEDENTARPSMEETLLAPLVADATDMVGIAAQEKNVSIEISCPPDLSAKLYGPFIIQALVNLLDNGIKYSDSGSCITIRAFGEGETLIIEVQDRGIGIPAEHLGRIFERFYRVDRSRSREQGGTGLGLAIVRHIALLHNGSAEVESHAGEGSVFRLRLPSN